MSAQHTPGPCPACNDTGVISTYDGAGLVDRFACDLCAPDGPDCCAHGVRFPHECRECADEPRDEEIKAWMEAERAAIAKAGGAS